MKKKFFTKANILILSGLVLFTLLFTSCENGFLNAVNLGSAFDISGNVTDTSGTAIEGVEITLIDAPGVDTVTTDSSGNYTLHSVPAGSYAISAKKGGLYVYTEYKALAIDGSEDLLQSTSSLITIKYMDLENINFNGISTSDITIPVIQGSGAKSPLEGEYVSGVVGVVTKVTYKLPHFLYDTTTYIGTTVPQYVGADGFYLQATGAADDGLTATSNAIFVSTHNPNFEDSKWLDTVSGNIKEGDVVSVSGVVTEYLPVNRFGSSDGHLSVTRINNPTVFHVLENGVNKTEALPIPVSLTNTTGKNSATERSLPWEVSDASGLGHAITLYESLEGMLVVVNDPLVVGGSYYNVAGVLADNGQQDGVDNINKTETGGIHINVGMDFNPEIIYIDYTSADWYYGDKLCQQGDLLKNDNGDNTLTGVIDYTSEAIYWISPLLTTGYHGNFDFDQGVISTVINSGTIDDYKLDPNEGALRTNSADPRMKEYNKAGNSTMYFSPFTSVLSTSNNGFTQNSNFLTVAEYNIENFDNLGSYNFKAEKIAGNMVYNMGAPDIITITEMGDENDSSGSIFYDNQTGSYYMPDGSVSSAGNYKAIINAINKLDPSLNYDFRDIAPEDGKDGGKPGTNIRVGFLFNKDRVNFIDSGIPTNSVEETPVTYPSEASENLARSETGVFTDEAGEVHLLQSPGRIQGSIFNYSRKSLVGEFEFNGHNLFVIVNHFKSKRGDSTLYGTQQPPIMGSEYTRGQQAELVNDFVDSILSINGNANIIVTGDFNDFQFSTVMKKLSGEYGGRKVLWGMAEKFLPVEKQYSYSYKGNYQQLDHIYASKNLMDNHDAASLTNPPVWIGHINSHFSMNNHFEFSDHDPIVAAFKMVQE